MNKGIVKILGQVVLDQTEVLVVEESYVLLGCLTTEEVLATPAAEEGTRTRMLPT